MSSGPISTRIGTSADCGTDLNGAPSVPSKRANASLHARCSGMPPRRWRQPPERILVWSRPCALAASAASMVAARGRAVALPQEAGACASAGARGHLRLPCLDLRAQSHHVHCVYRSRRPRRAAAARRRAAQSHAPTRVSAREDPRRLRGARVLSQRAPARLRALAVSKSVSRARRVSGVERAFVFHSLKGARARARARTEAVESAWLSISSSKRSRASTSAEAFSSISAENLGSSPMGRGCCCCGGSGGDGARALGAGAGAPSRGRCGSADAMSLRSSSESSLSSCTCASVELSSNPSSSHAFALSSTRRARGQGARYQTRTLGDEGRGGVREGSI